MGVSVLKGGLQRASDVLRGTVLAASVQPYLIPLLLLRRVAFDGPGAVDEAVKGHSAAVPEVARWSRIAAATTRVGASIDTALRALEATNPGFEGLSEIRYDDPEKLPDHVLVALLAELSRCEFDDRDGGFDPIGRANELLIADWAASAGRRGGEFYTPPEVAELLVRLLAPEQGMSVYDPCAGTGGLLLQAARHLAGRGELSLHGQEKNPTTAMICTINMVLHGLAADVHKGDTLREPRHTRGSRLKQFDRVISNPPFSLKNWGRENGSDDRFGRFLYGAPPRSHGDLAFVQHMIAACKPAGMIATVVPNGALFRRGPEQRIREGLVKDDLVEAAIVLPGRLFYGTDVSASVLVLNKKKPRNRRGKALFVDGSAESVAGKKRNVLGPMNVEKLVAVVHGYERVEGFARVVTRDEIASTGFDLGVARYVQPSSVGREIDLATEVKRLRVLEAGRDDAERQMHTMLAELGYE